MHMLLHCEYLHFVVKWSHFIYEILCIHQCLSQDVLEKIVSTVLTKIQC